MIFHKELISKLFKKLNAAAKKSNTEYWLEAGTLLGAVREGKIIGGDLDIDIAISYNKNIKYFKKFLLKEGFKKIKHFSTSEEGIVEETYMIYGIQVDIFYHFKDQLKNCSYRYCFNGIKKDDGVIDWHGPLESIRYEWTPFKLQPSTFYNVPIKIPENAEQYLEEHYGKNWRIPCSSFDYTKDPTNIGSKEITGKLKEEKKYGNLLISFECWIYKKTINLKYKLQFPQS